MTVARPPVVPQAEWDTALASLAEREAAVAAAMHELGAARKRMPMVRVDHDYRFDGPDGSLTLLELFDDRGLLVTVDGVGDPDDITADLVRVIDARLGTS